MKNSKNVSRIRLAAGLLLLVTFNAFAQDGAPRRRATVNFNVGEPAVGLFVEADATNVKLETDKGILTIKLETVASISFGDATASTPTPEVKPVPAVKSSLSASLHIEYLIPLKSSVGEEVKIKFRLLDAATGKGKDGLEDVRVLFFLSSGIWQQRMWTESVGDGVYEAMGRGDFGHRDPALPPQSGVYSIFVESRSQGVTFKHLPYFTLQVVD